METTMHTFDASLDLLHAAQHRDPPRALRNALDYRRAVMRGAADRCGADSAEAIEAAGELAVVVEAVVLGAVGGAR
jgi:hypothetical protein